MFNSMLLSAVSLLALTNFVSALPAEVVYPEVIPGPGLPSLASIGLTSKDLYTMVPTGDILEARAAAYAGGCQTFSTANVDDAIACFNYLNAIGGTCGTNAANVIMCTSGSAQISGANLFPGTSQIATCANCAVGVQWIFTNCNSGGQVGGQAPAYGNGNLIMGVQNISWNGKKL